MSTAAHQGVVEMLVLLSHASAYRHVDGLGYWGQILPRRLETAKSCESLQEWVSYLMGALSVHPYTQSAATVLERINEMSPEAEAEALRVIRGDHRMLLTACWLFRHAPGENAEGEGEDAKGEDAEGEDAEGEDSPTSLAATTARA